MDSLEHIHSLFNLFLHFLIRAVTVWNIYKVTPYNNVFTCILNHCLTMNTYFSSNTELGLCLSVCQSPSKDHNCFWWFNKSDNWPSETNSCMTLIITGIKCEHNGSKVNSSSRGGFELFTACNLRLTTPLPRSFYLLFFFPLAFSGRSQGEADLTGSNRRWDKASLWYRPQGSKVNQTSAGHDL